MLHFGQLTSTFIFLLENENLDCFAPLFSEFLFGSNTENPKILIVALDLRRTK